jgi:hypothetical protein
LIIDEFAFIDEFYELRTLDSPYITKRVPSGIIFVGVFNELVTSSKKIFDLLELEWIFDYFRDFTAFPVVIKT